MALRFHHCRLVEYCRFGLVEAVRTTELAPEPACAASGECVYDAWHEGLHFEAAYAWVAERVGFWPVFVAVGETDEDRRMTTYQHQFWRRRTPGPRSAVLFSWSAPPGELVYMDYMEWHIVLNSVQEIDGDPHGRRIDSTDFGDVEEFGDFDVETAIFQPSWTPGDWLARARETGVQAVAPRIDLSSAEEIWVPNQRTGRALRELGFDPGRILVRGLHQGQRVRSWGP